ncbi:phosphatase PAP2 family protein [Jatrophihabitans sp. YIM 134969]
MSLRQVQHPVRARGVRATAAAADEIRLRPLWQEALFLVTLLVLYRIGRLFGDMDATRGLRAGASVLDLEAALHLPSERSVQALALHVPDLVRAVNVYYAVMHFTVVVLSLLWLHHWRPAGYLLLRRTLVAATAAGLAVQLLAPVAPPRMQPGFVDTGRLLGPSVYGAPADDHLTNQFAAMPSLHVGWALAVALVLVAVLHSRWRWLAVVHPVVTLAVVVVTGNHYWLDAVVGSLLVVLAFGCARHRGAGQVAERRALASLPSGG